MILSKCDQCGAENSFETDQEHKNSGWTSADGKVTCLVCRLEEIEYGLRSSGRLFDRMLESDLIRKETCKSFHKDLEKLRSKFAKGGLNE